MGKSALDAVVNNEIFRQDQQAIIAMRRDLATLQPVRLKLESGGYTKGQILAKNTVTGLFEKFSSASGTYQASCVLFEDISADDQPSTGGALARALTSAYVFKDKLIDYSATAKTQLQARDISDASGIDVTKF